MSIVFVPEKLRGCAQIPEDNMQRLLDENDQLIRCIVEYQNKGRATECSQYQQIYCHTDKSTQARRCRNQPIDTSKFCTEILFTWQQ